MQSALLPPLLSLQPKQPAGGAVRACYSAGVDLPEKSTVPRRKSLGLPHLPMLNETRVYGRRGGKQLPDATDETVFANLEVMAKPMTLKR